MKALRIISMFAVTAPLWAATSMAQTNQDLEKLAKAGKCQVGSYRFVVGQNVATTLATNNDGNWCWTDSYYRTGGQYMSAYYVSVTKDNPPKHGRIMIGDIPNSKVRIAYQPASGFVGTDSFTIHFGVADSTVAFTVTVSQ